MQEIQNVKLKKKKSVDWLPEIFFWVSNFKKTRISFEIKIILLIKYVLKLGS